MIDFLIDLCRVGAFAVGVLDGEHFEEGHAECIDVHGLGVHILEKLRRRPPGIAQHGIRGLAAADDAAQLAQLQLVGVGIDSDVCASDITVDEIIRVQVLRR